MATNVCPRGVDGPVLDVFEVIVENVACNSEGFSCTKSILFKYRNEV